MKKVCFVCLGNICRSPMAEYVMKDLAPHIESVSRATSSYEIGNPVYPGTQEIFRKYAIPFDGLKTAQQIKASDFEEYDLILGMDQNNVRDLLALAPAAYKDKVQAFAKESVPDPWYTGDFEETYERVLAGCKEWIERLEEDHG